MSGETKIDRLVRAVEEMQALLPEAHGLLKDLRSLKKEIVALLLRGARTLVEDEVRRLVDASALQVRTNVVLQLQQAAEEVFKDYDSKELVADTVWRVAAWKVTSES